MPTAPVVPAAPPRRRLRGAIRPAILGAAFAVTFGVGIGVGRVPDLVTSGAAAASPAASPANELALVDEAWNKLHQNYVDAANLDDQKLAYAAIDGMTNAIGDTGHTEFMTPEERASRRSSLSGSYAGIGAEVDTSPEGLPMVVGVFRGSPAEKAGLHAGDIVLTIDGTTTKGETLDESVGRVRGEPGTTVKLTVRNGADGPVRNVDIVRADVHIDPVSWAMVPGSKTAVLRLEQFSTGAADELHKALQDITKAGADRLILDLRGNPGGFVNEAVAIASEFLPSGNVYIERNAKGEEKASPVKPGGLATTIPLVVLVDEGTASAAEIVSGAIQDAGRATLVGQKTFGTGTVLGEFPLVGWFRAPHRDGRVADAEGPRHLAQRDRPRPDRRSPGRHEPGRPRRPQDDDGGTGEEDRRPPAGEGARARRKGELTDRPTNGPNARRPSLAGDGLGLGRR